MLYLSRFLECRVLSIIHKEHAFYRRVRINTYVKPIENRHFLGALEHFFDIITFGRVYRASTCVKMACQ